MINTICLNETHSTTKLVRKDKPEIMNNLEDKFESVLFLPEGEGRKGEGGLRTKGYFKKSYDGKPLISIITVVYNGEQYLEETIQSVINQTYDNIEYIIIDGGSTDGTLDIIRNYEDQIDYWVSEKDNGIYDAWNKGVVCSTGEWIGFLGADDFYLSEAIQTYVNHAQKDYDYISSRVEIIDENKKFIKHMGHSWSWKIFRRYMNVAHVGSLHNRKLYAEHGLYDYVSYKIAGDYELLLRKRDKLRTAYFDSITAKMRNSGVSNCNTNVVFRETLNAKLTTANRNILFAYTEYSIGYLKYFVKSVLVRYGYNL